jgi:hypothetical protein
VRGFWAFQLRTGWSVVRRKVRRPPSTKSMDVMARDRAAIRRYERLGGRRMGVHHYHGDGLTEPAVVFAFPPPATPSCGVSWSEPSNVCRSQLDL